GDGDRHAGRRGHPDEERRAAVKRPSRRAEPAAIAGQFLRGLHGLAHRVVGLAVGVALRRIANGPVALPGDRGAVLARADGHFLNASFASWPARRRFPLAWSPRPSASSRGLPTVLPADFLTRPFAAFALAPAFFAAAGFFASAICGLP